MNTSEENYFPKQIKPSDLRGYLRNKGWTEENFPEEGVTKFKSPQPIRVGGASIDIFIPASERLVGYKNLMKYALKSISSFEKRSTASIINEILNFADCLKTRIIEAKRGVIPLGQGVILYENMFELITFSACSEYEPNVKKFSRKLDRAITFAETSLLGQSELGSYVSNIYLPLRRPNPEFSWDLTSPFPRKVVLRILRGLENLVDSENENSPDPIISNYRRGLNSNMCSALINIINVGMGNKVIVNAILEPTYPSPDDISTQFILSPSSEIYLQQARDALKEDASSAEEKSFIGYVKLLTRPEEIEKGTIVLRTVNLELNRTLNIRMELNDSDYQLAVKAHSARKYIRVRGLLDKIGRRWILNNPNNMEVLEEDSELPWRTLDRFNS